MIRPTGRAVLAFVCGIPLALIVLGALLMVEFFLRLRERTQWRPE